MDTRLSLVGRQRGKGCVTRAPGGARNNESRGLELCHEVGNALGNHRDGTRPADRHEAARVGADKGNAYSWGEREESSLIAEQNAPIDEDASARSRVSGVPSPAGSSVPVAVRRAHSTGGCGDPNRHAAHVLEADLVEHRFRASGGALEARQVEFSAERGASITHGEKEVGNEEAVEAPPLPRNREQVAW